MTRRLLHVVVICSAALSLGIGALGLSANAGQSRTPAGREKPQSFEQISRAAGLARNQNHDDEAIGLYAQALQLRPDWQEGLWYQGTLFYQKQDFVQAREVLRRFVALDSQASPGWVVLG